MVITRLNAIHALLYLIVSLLSVALVFYVLGAPFAAALEVIIYAGAILVLFIFAAMILDLGREAVRREKQWLGRRTWIGPAALAAVLLVELVYLLTRPGVSAPAAGTVEPRQVGLALFGPYLLGVE